MLDWHRDKKDFRTKFLNLTTMVGNIFLLIVLLTVLALVNHNLLCIPDSLLLNPSVVNIPGCNQSNERHDATNNTISNASADSQEGTTDFYLLNMVVLCLICPLGLASIVISLSEYWLVKVQEMKWIIKLKRSITLQVDGILAISALLCTIVFALFLVPAGINAINLISTMPCYTEAVMNVISSIVLFVIGGPSMYYGIRNMYTMMKSTEEMEYNMKEEIKRIYNAGGDMNTQTLLKMICSFFSVAILLVTVILHFWTTSDSLTGSNNKRECNRHMDLYPVTIFLLVCDIIILLLTLFMSVFYTLRYRMYQKLEEIRLNDPELIALNKIS